MTSPAGMSVATNSTASRLSTRVVSSCVKPVRATPEHVLEMQARGTTLAAAGRGLDPVEPLARHREAALVWEIGDLRDRNQGILKVGREDREIVSIECDEAERRGEVGGIRHAISEAVRLETPGPGVGFTGREDRWSSTSITLFRQGCGP